MLRYCAGRQKGGSPSRESAVSATANRPPPLPTEGSSLAGITPSKGLPHMQVSSSHSRPARRDMQSRQLVTCTAICTEHRNLSQCAVSRLVSCPFCFPTRQLPAAIYAFLETDEARVDTSPNNDALSAHAAKPSGVDDMAAAHNAGRAQVAGIAAAMAAALVLPAVRRAGGRSCRAQVASCCTPERECRHLEQTIHLRSHCEC